MASVSAKNSQDRPWKAIRNMKIPSTHVLFMIAAPCKVESATEIVLFVFFNDKLYEATISDELLIRGAKRNDT